MRFDSVEFLLFFPLVLVLHRLLPWRRGLLIVASYLFYASWNPPFLLLLLGSSALDYTVGRRLERTDHPGKRKALLAISLTGNLGVLAFFKYFNFLLDNLGSLGLFGAGALEPLYLQTEIPLGISFYTFQTISYTIDVYRRRVPACRSVRDFALFVSFFPQLIAGPILRASHFIPQIAANRVADGRQTLEGIELVLVGLFKKLVLANNLAILVDRCYEDPGKFSGEALLVASISFAVQIYLDFSAYSTIARGLARMLGYQLPRNFLFPLLAANPMEYRRGWHMTMGDWFRDYLYRPLGGDRKGPLRTVVNTMLTWAAFGLWHGAHWNYLLWGLWNGVLLTGYRLAAGRIRIRGADVGLTILSTAFMLTCVCIGAVVFRSEDLATAGLVFGRIFTMTPGEQTIGLGWPLLLVGLYGWHWLNKAHYDEKVLARSGWPLRLTLVGGTLLVLCVFSAKGEPFF